jgi:hypothetical protein
MYLTIAAAVVLSASTSARVQSQGTKLHITVADATTEVFILDAEVTVEPFGLKRRTDFLGDARFPALPSGFYTVKARRVGYEPLSTPAKLSGGDSLEIVLLLAPRSQELPSVTIEEEAPSPFLKEFDERRRSGTGYYVTEAELQASPGKSIEAIAATKIPGITIRSFGTGPERGVFSTRGTHSTRKALCAVSVYLNGMRVGNDPTIVPLDFIGGIEYYPAGRIPVQYQELGNDCGVMLLWPRP